MGGQKFQHKCGQCIGCRLDKAREWSVRCIHEASLYENNCFITLTFNDDWLYRRKQNPAGFEKGLSDTWSLQRGKKSEFELFIKRLRNAYGAGIRFYMCGEYGENCFYCFKNERNCSNEKCCYKPTIGRPHYHAIIFNHDFLDKRPYKVVNGNRLYTSDALQDLWTDPQSKIPMGFCTLGDVTIDSAGYVARYTTKKVTGKGADEPDPETGLTHYERFDPNTAEIHILEPEYNNMSRMPGLGMKWLQKFHKEVLVNDSVLAKEYPVPVPKYYDKLLENIAPLYFDENKQKRIDKAMEHADNNTTERLAVREMIQEQKAKFLPRKEN
jgi:hypothetical protein